MMLMNFLRKTALVIITPIFTFLLFAAAFDMGILRVVSQPNNVKQVLSDSGVYNSAVNSLLDQAKQETSNNGSLDLTNPTIKSAANATITPQYLQQNTDSAIDAVYAWLNGKTPQPQFSIDVSSLKDKFAAAASQAAEQRATTLPACTDAASASAAVNDPVAATCLPPGVTPAAVGSEVQGNLLGGQGFLDNATIDASTIKGKNSNHSIFASQLKDAPKQYQRIKKTPIILSLLALLSAVAIVFLSSSRRKGLRHVGILLVIIGIFMLVLAWGMNEAVTKEVPKIKLNNAVAQTDVRKVIVDLEQKIDQNYWIFGAVYTVLGALAIAAAIFWPGENKKSKQANDDLEGEGRTAADRIDLKAPDKATNLSEPKAKATAKTPAEPKPAKKNIEVK